MDGLFQGLDTEQPPLSASDFKSSIVQKYADTASSVGIRACIGEAVDEIWPAPGYREHQQEAVIDILHSLYVEDNAVTTLSAPTGAGKSLILYAAMAVVANEFDRNSFFTTPLNALIDQVDDDEFIRDEVITLKGKNNYSCVHPKDAGTSVDNAICQRVDDFECEFKSKHPDAGGCGYYGRKNAALQHPEVVTNLSYLMANSMIPDTVDSKFEPREIVTIDECIPEEEVVTTVGGRQVKIGEFNCDETISVDVGNGSIHHDTVEAVKKTKVKDCVRVHATRGSFMASHDHQMKGVDGWKDAESLDRIARPLCSVGRRGEEETRAALLGYWFGDGWISTSTGVSGDVVDLEQIDNDVDRVYGYTHTRKRSHNTSGSVESVSGSRHSIDGETNTYGYSKTVGDSLQDDGLVSGDKTLQDCHIPNFDTCSELKSFIAGFFGAEGYVPSQATSMSFNVIKATRYTTGDCVFLDDMQNELDKLGIDSYIEKRDGNIRKDGTETVCYELVIKSGRENLHRFLSEVGFQYCRRKEIEAEKIRCFLGDYLIESKQWQSDYRKIVGACKQRDWEYGAVNEEVEKRGYGNKMKRYVSKRKQPKAITEFPGFEEWCERYVEGNIVYERVKEVENIGEKQCYDMTVSDNHNFLVGDEYLAHNCQSIEDFALGFVEVVVSKQSVPVVWDDIEHPPHTEDVDGLAGWLQESVLPLVRSKVEEFEMKPELTEEENDQQEDLEQFARKCNNLIHDVRENHWVANRKADGDDWRVEFKPIFIGRFLERFLWSQGHKVILSSATIPKGDFLEEIGLGGCDVGHVEVESTFPTERRPIHTDESVGKMTMGERDKTLPKMARRIADIAEHHWEQEHFRGFVHCHSYKIAQRLYDNLPQDVKLRTRLQDSDRREESLDDWLDADVDEKGWDEDSGGQVFLSVSMDEGISLDDWRARWQVVAKAAYPYLGPEAKRANYRMDELNDWTWYCGSAAINLQQAVGRGMRSKDDWCHTYILDKSATDMIEKNEYLFEDWSLDGVDVESSGIPERY